MFFGFGESAALLTSVSWAGSCQVHTIAGRMIGPVNLIAARTPLFLTASGIVLLLSGADISTTPAGLFFVLCSGIMGMTIADPFLYGASMVIGPRLAVLVLSLSACITALLGSVFLGEHINGMGWLGILTATFGVVFVLLEGGLRHGGMDFSGLSRKEILLGLLKAGVAAFSLATSFILLKQGLQLGMPPLWASFLRILIGGGTIIVILFFRGYLFRLMHDSWTSWKVMRVLLLGCGVSTFGNCLSPFAFKYTQAGIAATLIGLQPIMIIIITAAIKRQMPSVHAVVGTCIACAGTAMIFLR